MNYKKPVSCILAILFVFNFSNKQKINSMMMLDGEGNPMEISEGNTQEEAPKGNIRGSGSNLSERGISAFFEAVTEYVESDDNLAATAQGARENQDNREFNQEELDQIGEIVRKSKINRCSLYNWIAKIVRNTAMYTGATTIIAETFANGNSKLAFGLGLGLSFIDAVLSVLKHHQEIVGGN